MLPQNTQCRLNPLLPNFNGVRGHRIRMQPLIPSHSMNQAVNPPKVIKLVWRKPKQYLCSQFPRLAELISRDPEAGLRKFSALRQLQLWLKRPQ